jgi:6-phospho-beta-glucosidase
MKVVILGGSSASTPVLFRCLGAQSEVRRLEFCLVGRSQEHLASVLQAARMLAAQVPISFQSCSFARSELIAALHGAGVVLIQIRFGGYEGRNFDETFPLHYDLCGDEGLGVGGLSAAWRAWPAMCNLLSTIASVCPDATVLMLSSPLGVFVGAARRLFPALNVYGICELPWTTLCELSTLLNADAAGADFDYLGVNHLGWFYRIEFEGRDLLLEYMHQNFSGERWPSSDLVASCHALPTKYLRLHYDQKQVLEEQRDRRVPRAEALQQISHASYRAFRTGEEHAILAALERRPAPWYDHAVLPFVLSSTGVPNAIPFFLTGPVWPNPVGFDSGQLLEVPVLMELGKVRPKPWRKPPPSHLVNTLNEFLAYERQAISAVIERDARQIQSALEIHPWIVRPELAATLAVQITAQPKAEAF